jgi:magnesium chelatase accessory protein
MTYALDWERDGGTWPHREASRFVDAGGTRFHVQELGQGNRDLPGVLLVHGTGAATHSWRGLLPPLAASHRVVAMDLPGHGFTPTLPGGRLTIEAMARAVTALCDRLEFRPGIVIGHSAGAVILIRMALDEKLPGARIISLNGALMPLGGFIGQLFSPIAKLMVLNPFTPSMMSRHFRDETVLKRLMRDTGSTLDAEGLRLYGILARQPSHIAGALDMMANWDLPRFVKDLPRLKHQLTLVAGTNDRTIVPADADRAKALVPHATVIRLPRLGHLAHEESPEAVMAVIERRPPTPAP